MATPNNKQRKPQRVIRFNIINIVWFVVAAVIIGWWMMDETGAPSKTTWNEVEQMVKGNKVEKIVVVNRDMARVYLTPEAIEEYRATDKYANIPEAEWQFQFNIGSVDSFREDLGKAQNEESNIIVDYVNEGGGWGETLISFLPWLIFIGIWIFMMRSMSGGGGGAGYCASGLSCSETLAYKTQRTYAYNTSNTPMSNPMMGVYLINLD